MQAGQGLPQTLAFQLIKGFVAGLAPLASYDLTPLLRPDNICIIANSMQLRQLKLSGRQRRGPHLYSGFTAAECYDAPATPAGNVYFCGALLYTLLKGFRPPAAPRLLLGELAPFPKPNTLEEIVNFSMAAKPENRIQALPQLYDILRQNEQKIYLENKRSGD